MKKTDIWFVGSCTRYS